MDVCQPLDDNWGLSNEPLKNMAVKSSYRLLIFGLLFTACDSDVGPALPSCLWSKIEQQQTLPPGNPPRSVVRITTTDKQVYFLITPTCCDAPSTLLDENCNIVCSSGGWGGSNCPDHTVEESVVVWQDTREIPPVFEPHAN
jgi:hypothetical protein